MCENDKKLIKEYAPKSLSIPASVIFAVNEAERDVYIKACATLKKSSMSIKNKRILNLRKEGYSNIEISQMLNIPYSEVREL
jgi:DNA-binding NarL/FixJ family response regulator